MPLGNQFVDLCGNKGSKTKTQGYTRTEKDTHVLIISLLNLCFYKQFFFYNIYAHSKHRCTVYLETIHNASLVKHFVVLQNGLKYFLPQNPAYNTP